MPAIPTTAVDQSVNLLLVPLRRCVKGARVGRMEAPLSFGSGRIPVYSTGGGPAYSTGGDWNEGCERATVPQRFGVLGRGDGGY